MPHIPIKHSQTVLNIFQCQWCHWLGLIFPFLRSVGNCKWKIDLRAVPEADMRTDRAPNSRIDCKLGYCIMIVPFLSFDSKDQAKVVWRIFPEICECLGFCSLCRRMENLYQEMSLKHAPREMTFANRCWRLFNKLGVRAPTNLKGNISVSSISVADIWCSSKRYFAVIMDITSTGQPVSERFVLQPQLNLTVRISFLLLPS